MSTRQERQRRRAEERRTRRLRPMRFDDLGLRRALSDRLLPLLVAAMAFLAALAFAGYVAADALGRHWQEGAAASMTVQVPRPTASADDKATPEAGGNNQADTRRDAVLAVLRATRGIASAEPMSDQELTALLRPWLGSDAETLSLPLPAVIRVRQNAAGSPGGGQGDGATLDMTALAAALERVAPGTVVESHGVWLGRLTALAHSLQLCAGLVLIVVTLVAVCVIAVATRAGLMARREAIEIVHGLGATDGYIARRFAGRTTALAAAGGLAGGVLALPVLIFMGRLTAPFGGLNEAESVQGGVAGIVSWLPLALWMTIPCMPMGAACIGWLTTQMTVRRWLRRLP
ncbi:Cell division protein ftsX [Granulibacter bethesdensis]|uniref:cell division protein FtsX n=1 Tax=Granulibacter bethesdensis TaxID=364410 RepID=UPI00090CD374|nr:Cell division protein ftsX [Granulibacter bethesdensis]